MQHRYTFVDNRNYTAFYSYLKEMDLFIFEASGNNLALTLFLLYFCQFVRSLWGMFCVRHFVVVFLLLYCCYLLYHVEGYY